MTAMVLLMTGTFATFGKVYLSDTNTRVKGQRALVQVMFEPHHVSEV